MENYDLSYVLRFSNVCTDNLVLHSRSDVAATIS